MSFIATTLIAGFVLAFGLAIIVTLISLVVDVASPELAWAVVGVFSLGLLFQSIYHTITGSFLK